MSGKFPGKLIVIVVRDWNKNEKNKKNKTFPIICPEKISLSFQLWFRSGNAVNLLVVSISN